MRTDHYAKFDPEKVRIFKHMLASFRHECRNTYWFFNDATSFGRSIKGLRPDALRRFVRELKAQGIHSRIVYTSPKYTWHPHGSGSTRLHVYLD